SRLMAPGVDELHAGLQRVLSHHLINTVEEVYRAAAVVPGHIRRINDQPGAAIDVIVSADHDGGKFSSKSVVEEMSQRKLQQIEWRAIERDLGTWNITEFDSLHGDAEREVVEKGRGNDAGQVALKSGARPLKGVLHRRKAVGTVCPLWNSDRRLPVIVHPAQRELCLRAEVMVDFQKLLAPVCRQRDGGNIA